MKLRFLAREDLLARIPGVLGGVGQAAPYVGRVLDPKTASYPATDEPVEVDDQTAAPSDLAQWKNLARRGEIWPADEATACACGADFRELVFQAPAPRAEDDKGPALGAWVVRPKAAAPAPPPPPEEDEAQDVVAAPGWNPPQHVTADEEPIQ